MNGRLKIVQVEARETQPRETSQKEKLQIQFEKEWQDQPEKFNPERNCLQRLRVKRTKDLLKGYFRPAGKKVADLGCGQAPISIELAKAGSLVDAVDIAPMALKHLEELKIENIFPHLDFVPKTTLSDDYYDLVISTEVIIYLPPKDFRLFFSELSRLVRPDGFVLCSAPIDIYSDDALQRFAQLAETEFIIDAWVLSYHALYLRLLKILETPQRYIEKPSLFNFFWKSLSNVLKPFHSFMTQNQTFLKACEAVCRFTMDINGISHAIFIGRRKPLIEPETQPVIARKGRKQIWE